MECSGQFFFSSISSLDLRHFSKMSWKILLLLSHCMPYLWSAVDNFFLVPYHLWTWGIFQKWVEKLCFYCPTACHIYGVQWDHIFFSSISSLDLGHFFQKWVEKIYFFCPTACHIYGVQWDLFFLLPHHLWTWGIFWNELKNSASFVPLHTIFMVCSGTIFFSSISSVDLGHFSKMSWKILLLLSYCMPYLWSAVDNFFFSSISSLDLGHFSKMSWKILLLLSHCMPYLWSAVDNFFFSSISSLDLGHFSKMSWKIMLLLSHCMPYLWCAVGSYFF